MSSYQFSTLSELASDKGWIGEILRTVQPDVILEADRWAAQTVSNRSARLPDPWQFLIDAPSVGDEVKSVARAAQSQVAALKHIIAMELGFASLSTNWFEEAMQAKANGEEIRYNQAMSKVANALAFYGPQQRDIAHGTRLIQKSFHLLRKKRRHQLIHSGKRSRIGFSPKPQWPDIRQHFPNECFIAERWVNFHGSDLPGLMFWSQAATDKLVAGWFGRPEPLTAEPFVRPIIRRLGLIPFKREWSPINRFEVAELVSGKIQIQGGNTKNVFFNGVMNSRKGSI